MSREIIKTLLDRNISYCKYKLLEDSIYIESNHVWIEIDYKDIGAVKLTNESIIICGIGFAIHMDRKEEEDEA